MDKAQYWSRKAFMTDNIWKRQAIVKRLLSLELINQDILEIGVGLGTAAAALNIIFLGNWRYRATDVSGEVVDAFTSKTNMDAQAAEIISLPFGDSSFDTVIALDVLEHVHPDEREQGYREIDRVLRPFGRVVLNIPLNVSYHEEHEHGFDINGMVELLRVCRMDLETWETYQVRLPDRVCAYVWATGVR